MLSIVLGLTLNECKAKLLQVAMQLENHEFKPLLKPNAPTIKITSLTFQVIAANVVR